MLLNSWTQLSAILLATQTSPDESTATPRGKLNCPFRLPVCCRCC